MPDELAPPVDNTLTQEAFDQLIQGGDLSRLTSPQRSQYVWKFTEKLGLNPLTKPIDLIPLNGKLTLYANRTATDQLAKIHSISVEVLDRELDAEGGTYTVRVRVKDPSGREDENIGSVGITNLSGEALANAKMKAYTKAKRRAILSFCGLGFLDELEIESIQGRSEEARAAGLAPAPSAAPAPVPAAPTVTVAAPPNPAPQIPAGQPQSPAVPPFQVPPVKVPPTK